MSRTPNLSSDVDINAPLASFSQCHAGMLSVLTGLSDLPGLLETADRARNLAQAALDLFDKAVFEHHAEEERELFPAVLRSAKPGEEQVKVQAMESSLTAQHRALERAWQELESNMKLVAKGKPAKLDAAVVQQLAESYKEHAAFEEQEFLPLAQQILGRDSAHMAALGLSLHARHMPGIVGYI